MMDQEIVDIIAPAFLEHYRSELESMRRAAQAGDTDDLQRRAHGMKGTLAAFGAEPAQRNATEIESRAKAGDLPAVLSIFPKLESATEQLVVQLRDRMNT